MSQRKKPGNKFFYGWVIAFLSFLTILSSIGPRSAFGNLVNPWATDFGWSLQQISFAASLSVFLYGVSQPFIGWLVNRFGPKKVTLGGLLAYGIASLLLSFINSLWQLYLLYGIVMGIAWSACSNVPLSVLVSAWFYKRRGIALSLVHSGMAIGQFLLIPLSMALILSQGWRLATAFLSFIVLGIALPMVWKLAHDNPQEMGLLPDGRTEEVSSTRAILKGRRDLPYPAPPPSLGLRAAMGTLSFWLLVGSFFICGLTAHLLSVHFVPAAISSGYAPMTAAKAAGLMGGASALGIWISGFLSDAMGRKIPLAALYLLRGLGLIMLLSSAGEPTLYLSAFLIGFGTLGTASLTAGLVADTYGVATMGTILGAISMGHQIGGGISIYLAGVIAHKSGNYYLAFLSAAFFLFAAFLSCLFIREKRPTFAEATPQATRRAQALDPPQE